MSEPSTNNESLLQRFNAVLIETKDAHAGNPHSFREAVAIALRHFVHPSGYHVAFDLMRLAAAAVGDSLTPDGYWEHGARGEVWTAKAAGCREAARMSYRHSPMDQRRPGYLGFTRYNEVPGPNGTWKTSDGRAVPGWEDVGPTTQARWVAAADAERDEALSRAAHSAGQALMRAGITDTDTLLKVQGAVLAYLSDAGPASSA